MLIQSMGASADGFIQDRDGDFSWSVPTAEQFSFHLEQVRELGALILGRRLWETMLVWETDPAMRQEPADAAFAEVWTALPKLVFSRTLTQVQGNARLATGAFADEVAAVLAATDADVEIGGATLAAEATRLDLVDEYRIFRNPAVVGGGTPYFPPIEETRRLDLVESRTFANQVLYERYRRVR